MPTQNSKLDTSEISIASFLESAPPGTRANISDLFISEQVLLSSGYHWVVNSPNIQLYCGSAICGGLRIFTGKREVLSYTGPVFLTYTCRNCNQTTKLFALVTSEAQTAAGSALKLGEEPPFGPPIPSRVISLIGPDRNNFLKGRQSENHGLGIGAFSYYRRVVEDQKGRLIEQIARVAEKLGADDQTLKRFEKAKTETQFSKAIDDIKGAIPNSLLINGHNPLTLLHTALSEGIHAQSDEECLAIATSIRVVLSELAERINHALKDEAELKNAVNRLLKKTP